MKKRYGILLILIFSYLLLFPDHALPAARYGLSLWYTSVVPVLLPFMLLGQIAIRASLLEPALRLLYRPFHFLFGCSSYGAFAILAGFLSGFPMGAKITHDLLGQQKIEPEEARFLYGFVNNPSPAFLITYLASDQLKQPSMKYTFLFTVLGSSLLYGIISSFSFRKKNGSAPVCLPQKETKPAGRSFLILDESMADAAGSMVRLGIYMMMFSILTEALHQLMGGSTHPAGLLLLSSIELTSGVQRICASGLGLLQKTVALNLLCSFGGCAVLAQTIGLAELEQEELHAYIKSRVLITLLSLLLSILLCVYASSSVSSGTCV